MKKESNYIYPLTFVLDNLSQQLEAVPGQRTFNAAVPGQRTFNAAVPGQRTFNGPLGRIQIIQLNMIFIIFL